jgi:hypothetical protein
MCDREKEKENKKEKKEKEEHTGTTEMEGLTDDAWDNICTRYLSWYKCLPTFVSDALYRLDTLYK